IQLSAERIARNFRIRTANGSERLDPSHSALEDNGNSTNGNGIRDLSDENRDELSRVVEECTTSITREVAGLKALVDEFSRFARMPPPRLEQSNLNEVIRQTAKLYDDRLSGAELRLMLDSQPPAAMLDVEQIKRVFVNLIDNALEALTDVQDQRCVTI